MERIIYFRYVYDNKSSDRDLNDRFQLTERQFSKFENQELAKEYEAKNQFILDSDIGDSRFLEKLFGKRNAFGKSAFTSNLYDDIPAFLEYHYQAFIEFYPGSESLFPKHTKSIVISYQTDEKQSKDQEREIKDLVKDWCDGKLTELNQVEKAPFSEEDGANSEKEIDIDPGFIKTLVNDVLISYFLKKEMKKDQKAEIREKLSSLLQGKPTDQKLNFFNDSKKFGHCFRELKKAGIIENTQDEIRYWIIDNFKYWNRKEKSLKKFNYGNLRKDMASGADAPKKPINIQPILDKKAQI